MPSQPPEVALLLPVFNESEAIDACLESIARQDYSGPITVVVADGRSTDDTLARVEAWRGRLDLLVVDNPARRQAFGLNAAAAAASAEILIRIDAHTEYASDYVTRSIDALQTTGARAAGGALRPRGRSAFGRAVAAAMKSRLATGTGRFHQEDASGEVDTVYLGAFHRSDYEELGGFRAFPSGAGEDADFYHRMRLGGGRIWLSPLIRSTYRPRERPGRLFHQHFRYGQAKAEMMWRNGALPSWRPLAPALLILAVIGGTAAAAAGTWWPLLAIGGLWLGALLIAGLGEISLLPLVVTAAAIMHWAYGLGFWWGVVRGPGSSRT